MTVSVSFKPCEGTEPTGKTLTDVPELMWARCRYGHHQVCIRFRDATMQVWGVRSSNNMLETLVPPPGDYEVLEILDHVRVLPPEPPPEPLACNLSELGPQVWVECEHPFLYGPGLRCHNGKGQVYRLDKDDVPYPVDSHYVPSGYTIAGKPIGQLRIKVTDDGT